METKVEGRIGRLKYTYSGYGLCRNGISFKADLDTWLPEYHKNGKPKQINRYKTPQTLKWWKQQCHFRGLDEDGWEETLQERLRTGPNTLKPEFARLSDELRAKWEIQRPIDLERARREEEEQKKKELEEAKSFVDKAFADLEPGLDAFVLKKDWRKLRDSLPALKLKSSTIKDPFPKGWEEWLIIGRDTTAVDSEISSLQEEADQARKAEIARQEAEEKAQQEEWDRKHKQVMEASHKRGAWDVTGKYIITCDELSSNWDIGKMTLTIYRADNSSSSEMFARFDFGILTGWFRFEQSSEPKPKSTKKSTTGSKRKRAVSDTGDDDEEDFQNRSHRPWNDGPEYVLAKTDKPSPKNPTMNFRWRGRDSSERQIQLNSDRDSNAITFSGKGGAKLSGIIETPFAGSCVFTGKKVEMANPGAAPRISIQGRWNELNERAYESERVSRWG
ncbi:hypothetical protein K402DRAFT_391010 [Aulographum hederae CBS 113979]|uniref:Uncharacterized protein n=1 Tax=Aulographum hederae CBS 113979 TaxID=1176131 RepID=A0A6G1H901_9PEZI|nr:hypothetical protein K402DRAFT_391010 [Aulographum hederae CBS 113979]